MPVENRISSLPDTSERRLGVLRPRTAVRAEAAALPAGTASTVCSFRVFQAPQALHLPCHFGVSLPHSVQ